MMFTPYLHKTGLSCTMAYMVPSQMVYKSPHSLGSQAIDTCLTKVNLHNLKNYIKLKFQ